MKTHGTQAVKDKSNEQHELKENEDSQHDEPDHQLKVFLDESDFDGPLDGSELRTALTAACQRVFSSYKPSTHSTWRELEQDVVKRFGRLLSRYKNRANQSAVSEAIVINLLIRAKKEIQDETDLDEM